SGEKRDNRIRFKCRWERGNRRGCWRTDTIGRETHSPETNDRLCKFKFHVATYAFVILRFDDLADHFLFCFFVGEEKQLARGHWRTEPDDGTIAENEHRLCSFGKRLALVRALDGSSAINGDGDFQRDRLRAACCRRFGERRWRRLPRPRA